MKPKTYIEISRRSLLRNINEFRKKIGRKTKIIFIVKGNAYGAGIIEVVSATKMAVDWYGVDSLYEANLVRRQCTNPILILGYISKEECAEIIKKKYRVVAYHYNLIKELSREATKNNPALIHLKVDVGLCRLGFLPKDATALARLIIKLPHIRIEGMCTHFARLLDKKGNEIYNKQLDNFKYALNAINKVGINPEMLHVSSSMAAILYNETTLDAIRVGIAIHGLWGRKSIKNLVERKGENDKFLPSIMWKTVVINIKEVKSGGGVGYLHRENVLRKTRIAVLGVGYFDGFDKRYWKEGYVLINGKRAKIIGSIAMTMCMVDITDIKNVKIGSTVILIGCSGKEKITAYDFADAIGTSTYEALSRINPLLPRILVP